MRKRLLSKLYHMRFVHVMAALILLSLLLFGFIVVKSYVNEHRVADLKVKQQGLSLCLSWNRVGIDKVELTIRESGGRTIKKTTTENSYTMDISQVGRRYKVKVRPVGTAVPFGGAGAKITAEKIRQNIYLDKYLVEGFVKGGCRLTGKSETPLSFRSLDESIATVSEDGEILFKKVGDARIRVSAPANDTYTAAKETAVVHVYPRKLETPDVTLTQKTDTDVSISWSAVPYADQYVVKKFSPWMKSFETVKVVKGDEPLEITLLRNDEKYTVQAAAKIMDKDVRSKASRPLNLKSTSHKAKTYTSEHVLAVFDDNDLETIAVVKGPGSTSCPQSCSYTGKGYLLAFTDKSGKHNALVEYDLKGNQIRSRFVNMGHANGSTYNPNTGLVYTLRRHLKIKSRKCKTFHFSDFSEAGTFTLPKSTSGISYDVTNNKFYLAGGGRIFIADSNFRIERTIKRVVRHRHTQDTGAGNGVAISCAWNGGSDSSVDLYRAADGAYLGTYRVPVGEIESAALVDKHLVVVINNKHGGHQDVIMRTKKRIPVI